MKKLLYPITLLLAFAFTFTACGSDDNGEEPLLPPGAEIKIDYQSYSINPFERDVFWVKGISEYGIERTEWFVEHQSSANNKERADFIHYRPGIYWIKANFYKKGQLVATDSVRAIVKQPTVGFMGINLYAYQDKNSQFVNDTIQLDLIQDKEDYAAVRLYCTVKPQFASSFNIRTFFDNYITSVYGEKRDTDVEETGYLIENPIYEYLKFDIKAGDILVDTWKVGTCRIYTIKSPEKGYYLLATR